MNGVISIRYFQCFDCKHFWKIIFSENSKGTKLACPECKSLNVHRIEKVRGWDREGKYTSRKKDDDQTLINPKPKSDRNILLRDENQSIRKPSIKRLNSLIRIVLNQGKLNGFIE